MRPDDKILLLQTGSTRHPNLLDISSSGEMVDDSEQSCLGVTGQYAKEKGKAEWLKIGGGEHRLHFSNGQWVVGVNPAGASSGSWTGQIIQNWTRQKSIPVMGWETWRSQKLPNIRVSGEKEPIHIVLVDDNECIPQCAIAAQLSNFTIPFYLLTPNLF